MQEFRKIKNKQVVIVRPKHTEQTKEKMERFKELFPEHTNKKIFSIVASLTVKEDMLNRLGKEGIYAMAYREWEYMDIISKMLDN